MDDIKTAIVGCGNLGISILNGLLKTNTVKPANLMVTRRNLSALATFSGSGVVLTSDNAAAVRESQLIILALKPYNILKVLEDLAPDLDAGRHIIVSLATGISLDSLHKAAGLNVRIFRAMPNTAADVGMSVTCISTDSDNRESAAIVSRCFDSIGETIMVDESLMNSATVLGACGVAYVLRFMRAMIQGGIQIGFDARTATNIVTHTIKGAAELILERKTHPEQEIDKVTTPRGCTIAGLNEMEHNGFSSALIKGIVTSFEEIR